MFEFIRTHQRLMQFLLLLLILPSFVLVGVTSYRERGADDGVATVDGKKISQQEWEAAQRRRIDQARQQMGQRFDQKMFDSPEAKQAVLDQLVAERAVNAEVARAHLTAGDEAVIRYIGEIPAFKKPDGKFDLDTYKAFLSSQGMTAEAFQARVAHDLALQQIGASIEQTAFAPKSVANRLSDLSEQEREVQEVLFPAANYVAQVKITDDMVKAFYDKHAAEFQVPEQVKAEYVVFGPETVEKQVSVSDAEVQDFYNKNKVRFTSPEQRSASHILINVAQDAPKAEDAAAKSKAEAVLAEVRKNPNDFAKIAAAKSEDTESAKQGGDLGAVERNVFAKPVEDAIYGLKEGEVSGLVRSQFGYHIVKLTKLVAAKQQPLDEAKPAIVAEVKKQKMSAKYAELAEAFTNTVYEQSDSLKPVADKLGLTIQTADGLTRAPNPALGGAPYNNEKFLKALFGNDTLKNKRNTDAVEVAPSTLAAGRVLDFKPAARRPLADVDAAIRQRLTQEEAARLARQAGEAKLAAAKGGDLSGFGEAKTVSRAKQPTINTSAALAVLKADAAKLPATIGVELPGQGYGVYRIVKVIQPAQPNAERRKEAAQQLGAAVGSAEMAAYIEALKHKAKAKVNVKAADLQAKTE